MSIAIPPKSRPVPPKSVPRPTPSKPSPTASASISGLLPRLIRLESPLEARPEREPVAPAVLALLPDAPGQTRQGAGWGGGARRGHREPHAGRGSGGGQPLKGLGYRGHQLRRRGLPLAAGGLTDHAGPRGKPARIRRPWRRRECLEG